MGQVFALAKEFIEMPPEEIEKLLGSPIHEVRAGGLSIMDKQARRKRTPESRRKELFDLYLRRTDRINNWDLVDVACPYVVGGYLSDKPRDVLYELARSNMWERRTAIVSTSFFIRQGDVDDTFRIAEVLLDDQEDLIHKAAGGWLREAGKKDHGLRSERFLDEHAATMPRTMLRYAIEHLDERGAEALPKHEEGRVGRNGIGAVQEGDRGGPRGSPRPTKPGKGLLVNGRAARAAQIPRTSRPPTFREHRWGEDRTTRFVGA